MSSSGLVLPPGSSALAAHVTGYVPTPDDVSATSPDPSMSDPSQWALAVRVVAMTRLLLIGRVVVPPFPATRREATCAWAAGRGDLCPFTLSPPAGSVVPCWYES